MRFLETTDVPPLQSVLHQLKYAITADPDAEICCAACSQSITHNKERIEIQGGSEHVFTNASGFTFYIICYRQAPGCIQTGIPTAEYSWFGDYTWCYAVCGNCGVQLGWYYIGSNRSFHGLIKNRLIEHKSGKL
ncbi:MAG TPA: cereblon family protein [Gammaproteobacteria bacterium]